MSKVRKMPKYSIIVPTYNMSRYLICCADSLARQSYADFEVLFVDDCSTDDSLEICKKIAEQDCRFRIAQQDRNRGLSSTRNLGMKNVSGSYILFVDPDDYVEPDWMQCLDDCMGKTNADSVTWGMYKNTVFPDGKETIEELSLNAKEDRIRMSPDKEDWKYFTQELFFASTCNKVYQREIIEKYCLEFDTGCVDFEDFIFNAQYFMYISSYAVLKRPFYHYRQEYRQVATLKRAWGKVDPFCVSRKVFAAASGAYDHLSAIHCEYAEIMFYAYKSYMSEVEYQYRSKEKKDFIKIVSKLADDDSFAGLERMLEQTSVKKLIFAMRFLTKMRMKRTLASVLWMLCRRELGSIKE